MGKGIQIANTVILGIISIILTIFVIMILLMSFSTGQSQGILTFSSVIYFIIWITSVFYFILLIRSFKRCNVESKSFKWAFYLNVIWIGLAILTFFGLIVFLASADPTSFTEATNLTDKANKITNIINPILGVIYFISFIVFLIGYFNNKSSSINQTNQ